MRELPHLYTFMQHVILRASCFFRGFLLAGSQPLSFCIILLTKQLKVDHQKVLGHGVVPRLSHVSDENQHLSCRTRDMIGWNMVEPGSGIHHFFTTCQKKTHTNSTCSSQAADPLVDSMTPRSNAWINMNLSCQELRVRVESTRILTLIDTVMLHYRLTNEIQWYADMPNSG